MLSAVDWMSTEKRLVTNNRASRMVGEAGVILPTRFAMTRLGMQCTGGNRLSRPDDFRYANRAENLSETQAIDPQKRQKAPFSSENVLEHSRIRYRLSSSTVEICPKGEPEY